MQKIFLVLLSAGLLGSCKKDGSDNCSPVNITAPASEIATLRDYISNNGISATEDPRGFFYSIDEPGSSDKPTPCDAVTVAYEGYLTDGTQFDASGGVTFNLSGLITGWQEGIPLIGSGGSITLYLPPSLAYGSSGYGDIPPNAILKFNISLINF